MSAADGLGAGSAVGQSWLRQIDGERARRRSRRCCAPPRGGAIAWPSASRGCRLRPCSRSPSLIACMFVLDAWSVSQRPPASGRSDRGGAQLHRSGQVGLVPVAARRRPAGAGRARLPGRAAVLARRAGRVGCAAGLRVYRHRAAGPVCDHRQAADRARPAVRRPATTSGPTSRSTGTPATPACRPATPPRPLRRWSPSARSFRRRGR